jgi:hypothetical protein
MAITAFTGLPQSTLAKGKFFKNATSGTHYKEATIAVRVKGGNPVNPASPLGKTGTIKATGPAPPSSGSLPATTTSHTLNPALTGSSNILGGSGATTTTTGVKSKPTAAR